MKVSTLLLSLLLILSVSCFSSKDYVTDYDYNYTGSFKKYKTFAFVESSELDNTVHLATETQEIIAT